LDILKFQNGKSCGLEIFSFQMPDARFQDSPKIVANGRDSDWYLHTVIDPFPLQFRVPPSSG